MENLKVIVRVLKNPGTYLRRKKSGEMYLSHAPCKHSSEYLNDMVNTGFPGKDLNEIIENHKHELEDWVDWIVRE